MIKKIIMLVSLLILIAGCAHMDTGMNYSRPGAPEGIPLVTGAP
jgi:hypothetical protein